jgi:MFS family permease
MSNTTPLGVAAAASPGPGLWRDRNFNTFWVGQTFDALGDSAALIVIPLLVLEATGSVAQMGLVTAAIGAGNLVSSMVSGVVVDRVDRRKVMILSDLGRMLFYLAIPLIWWLHGPSLTAIYVVATMTAYLTTFFFIAYTSVIPGVVNKEQITEANGRLQATVAVAYVAGPMLAGLASRHFSAINAVITVALSYGASAIFMLMVRLRKADPAAAEQSTDPGRSKIDNILAGVRFVFTHRVLRSVTVLLAIFSFISGATINLVIFRLKHDMGRNDDTVGIIFGIASVGAILAGVLAPALRRKKGFGWSFLGSNILMGAAIASIGLAPNVAALAALSACYSFGITVRNVSSMSLRQQVTPDRLLGRVTSAFWMILTVIGPLGTAAASMVAERAGAPAVLVATGLMCILLATAGLFTSANVHKPDEQFTSGPAESEAL